MFFYLNFVCAGMSVLCSFSLWKHTLSFVLIHWYGRSTPLSSLNPHTFLFNTLFNIFLKCPNMSLSVISQIVCAGTFAFLYKIFVFCFFPQPNTYWILLTFSEIVVISPLRPQCWPWQQAISHTHWVTVFIVHLNCCVLVPLTSLREACSFKYSFQLLHSYK